MYQSATEKYLFSKEWMDMFARYWNSEANSSSQKELAGTGEVAFAVDIEGKKQRGIIVIWGKDGKIKHSGFNKTESAIPLFSAPPGVWESVIYAYYTTIQAVVNRKMEFDGKMKFAISFSKKFPLVADVAIMVNQYFMQQ